MSDTKTPAVRLTLTLDECINDYGVLPCTAGKRVAGAEILDAGAAGYGNTGRYGFFYEGWIPPSNTYDGFPLLNKEVVDLEGGEAVNFGFCSFDNNGCYLEIFSSAVGIGRRVFGGNAIGNIVFTFSINGLDFTMSGDITPFPNTDIDAGFTRLVDDNGLVLRWSQFFSRLVFYNVDITINITNDGIIWQTYKIGAGGRCFNTFSTCQDLPNYRKKAVGREMMFISEGINTDGWMASIKSYTHQPAEIKVDFTNSTRERVKIKLADFVAGDTSIDDKYISIRPEGEVNNLSSWLARMVRRNTYFNRRPALVEIGFYIGGEFFLTNRHALVIDKVSLDDSRGEFILDLVDGLRIKEDDGAVCPRVSVGVLAIDMDEVSNQCLVSGAEVEDYDGAAHVSVGGEIMEVVSVNPSGGDVAVNVVRGAAGSQIETHDAGDTCQRCYTAQNINIVSVVEDLLTNYADIGSAKIDTEGFKREQELALATYNCNVVLPDPSGVWDLIEELQMSGLFNVWYDSSEGVIRLRSIISLSLSENRIRIDDNNFLWKSLKAKNIPRKAISRVAVYTDPRDFSDIGDKGRDYRHLQLRINAGIESEYARGEEVQATIRSRWIDSNVASSMSERLLEVGELSADELEFNIAAVDSGDYKVGGGVVITTSALRDEFGVEQEAVYRVVRVQYKDAEVASVNAVRVTYGGGDLELFKIGSSEIGSDAVLL